jgi:hypothetical protein
MIVHQELNETVPGIQVIYNDELRSMQTVYWDLLFSLTARILK